jgi:hypothetical protein
MTGCYGHGIHKIQVISYLAKAVLASQEVFLRPANMSTNQLVIQYWTLSSIQHCMVLRQLVLLLSSEYSNITFDNVHCVTDI